MEIPSLEIGDVGLDAPKLELTVRGFRSKAWRYLPKEKGAEIIKGSPEKRPHGLLKSLRRKEVSADEEHIRPG